MKLNFFPNENGNMLSFVKARGTTIMFCVKKDFPLTDVPAALYGGMARASEPKDWKGEMTTTIFIGFRSEKDVEIDLDFNKIKIKKTSSVDIDLDLDAMMVD